MRLVSHRNNTFIQNHIEGGVEQVRRGIRTAYFRIGHDLVTASRRYVLEGPKSGHIYLVRDRRARGGYRRHQASAPSESPANLTGFLRRSITYQQHGYARMRFGARAEYAPWLENGSERVKPRPFLIKAVYATERSTERHLRVEIERELMRTD